MLSKLSLFLAGKDVDDNCRDTTVQLLFNPLLGVVDASRESNMDSTIIESSSDEEETLSDLPDSDGERQAQKQEEEHPAVQQHEKTSIGKRCKRNRVQFADFNMLVLIPSHRDYNDDEHESQWTGTDEILLNARRNSFEFEYEGREWRKVVEEDQMRRCSKTGKLVHPAIDQLKLAVKMRRKKLLRAETKKRKTTDEEEVNAPNRERNAKKRRTQKKRRAMEASRDKRIHAAQQRARQSTTLTRCADS